MRAASFDRFAGLAAVLAALAGLTYSVSFVILSRSAPALGETLSALCLLLSGVLSTAALVAIYERLRPIEPGFAAWGLLLGLAGALGAAIHGGYDLANAINAPAGLAAGVAGLPHPVDARGLLTFGVAGLAQFVVAWLMTRGSPFPIGLAYLGMLSAALLIIIYLGRLTVLEATSPIILVPAVLEGFLVNPLWYVWLGLRFLGGEARAVAA